jgi:hypothetical protein
MLATGGPFNMLMIQLMSPIDGEHTALVLLLTDNGQQSNNQPRLVMTSGLWRE